MLADADDPEPPCLARYHVHVPDFAQLAGTRLLFTPGFFQHGAPALLSGPERTQPLVFPHAWTEIDTVRVHLPRGMRPELTPGGTTFPLQDVGQCSVELRPNPAGDVVLFVRRLSVEAPHSRRIPVDQCAGVAAALVRAQGVGGVSVMVVRKDATR